LPLTVTFAFAFIPAHAFRHTLVDFLLVPHVVALAHPINLFFTIALAYTVTHKLSNSIALSDSVCYGIAVALEYSVAH
jgi:hypothetical protein